MSKFASAAWLVDKYLPRLVVGTLLCLLVVQAGLAVIPGSGFYLNTALRLEGEPLVQEEISQMAGGITTAPWACISLQLMDYVSLPELKVLVDGQEAASFLKNEITLNVKQGNIIVIYNPYSYPITVRVAKSTPNVLEPAPDSRVNGTGRLYLPPVVLRE